MLVDILVNNVNHNDLNIIVFHDWIVVHLFNLKDDIKDLVKMLVTVYIYFVKVLILLKVINVDITNNNINHINIVHIYLTNNDVIYKWVNIDDTLVTDNTYLIWEKWYYFVLDEVKDLNIFLYHLNVFQYIFIRVYVMV